MLKRIRAGELIEDVKKVAAGASLMDPRTVARVVERLRKGPEEDPRTADLSPHDDHDPRHCATTGNTNDLGNGRITHRPG